MKRLSLLALSALALACGGSPAAEGEQPCAWLDRELGAPGEALVTLAPYSRVALTRAGREPATVYVREGQVALRPGAAGTLELQALKVVLRGFSLGEIAVADHGLLVQDGEASACASFDGELESATSVVAGFDSVRIDAGRQSLSLALTYEAEFEMGSGPFVASWFLGGARVILTGDLAAAGEGPWLER